MDGFANITTSTTVGSPIARARQERASRTTFVGVLRTLFRSRPQPIDTLPLHLQYDIGLTDTRSVQSVRLPTPKEDACWRY